MKKYFLSLFLFLFAIAFLSVETVYAIDYEPESTAISSWCGDNFEGDDINECITSLDSFFITGEENVTFDIFLETWFDEVYAETYADELDDAFRSGYDEGMIYYQDEFAYQYYMNNDNSSPYALDEVADFDIWDYRYGLDIYFNSELIYRNGESMQSNWSIIDNQSNFFLQDVNDYTDFVKVYSTSGYEAESDSPFIVEFVYDPLNVGYIEGTSPTGTIAIYGYFHEGSYLTADEWGAIQYNEGYDEGSVATSLNRNWFSSLMFSFFSVFNILSIELLPNVTIGMIVAVPLMLGLMSFIIGVATFSVSSMTRSNLSGKGGNVKKSTRKGGKK
jgi:hypothetical protein